MLFCSAHSLEMKNELRLIRRNETKKFRSFVEPVSFSSNNIFEIKKDKGKRAEILYFVQFDTLY
jgi:hypothetical protein